MGYAVVVGVAPELAGAIGESVAGQVTPSVVTETSRPLRGVVAFITVVLTGLAVRRLERDYVSDAVGAIRDRPARAIVYGIAGYVIFAIVALYGATTLARLNLAGGVLLRAVVVASSIAVVALTGFGFLVVGTLLADLLGTQRAPQGLVIGAVLSAAAWAALSPAGAVVASLAIAAFGIGGSARVWIHADRRVETEIDR